jgi:hypothetical protein
MPKETSKKVLLVVLIISLSGLIACVVGWFMGRSGASALAGIFAGLAGTEVAFYSWKAKNENVLKIVKSGDATWNEAIALSKSSAITSASVTYSGTDDDLVADADLIAG